MFFWNSLAFSMIQQMLAIWSLVPLPFLKPAWTSGSSWFMYCWSLAWRILVFSPGLYSFLSFFHSSFSCCFFLVPALLLFCNILPIPLVFVFLIILSNITFSFSSLFTLVPSLWLRYIYFALFSLYFVYYSSVSLFLSLPLLTGTIYPFGWIKKNKGRKRMMRKLDLTDCFSGSYYVLLCF